MHYKNELGYFYIKIPLLEAQVRRRVEAQCQGCIFFLIKSARAYIIPFLTLMILGPTTFG